MAQPIASDCLGSWIEMVEEKHEALRKLKHAAMKMLLQRLALGFTGWVAACEANEAGYNR